MRFEDYIISYLHDEESEKVISYGLIYKHIFFIFVFVKRFLVFTLLILQLNICLMPQVAETDLYALSGEQQDDVNSMFEMLTISLGYDTKADDEDDDTGQNFQVSNPISQFCNETIDYSNYIVKSDTSMLVDKQEFHPSSVNKMKTISFEIIPPPPKA